MKKLEERLYELRRENKLTQEEIAVAVNVSRQTISNWETGTARPTIDKAIELAEIYEVTLDSLVGNAHSESKKVSRLLKEWEGAKGTLFLQLSEKQPFFPHTTVKETEIVEVGPSFVRIRTQKKNVVEQTLHVKEVLGFLREEE